MSWGDIFRKIIGYTLQDFVVRLVVIFAAVFVLVGAVSLIIH
jgi:hypothetical protein